MRGDIDPLASMFSFFDLESRIPQQHPIRKIRQIVDKALEEIAPCFDEIYAAGGRPSIAPETLIRASLLQIFFTIAGHGDELLVWSQVTLNRHRIKIYFLIAIPPIPAYPLYQLSNRVWRYSYR